MSQNTAIKVKGVSKHFILPHERTNSLKGVFLGMFKSDKRTYETQRALSDISFEITKGEFFGIVGRNGSGKSTLLKILAGIYQPSKGNVLVNGKLVPFIELGVGFNPELSGRENVYLNGALLGFSRKQIAEKYKDIVEFAELERFMDQRLKNYSSGMQVRLAFSVATLLADSDILLIDEVLAVGDTDFQRKCFRFFKKLKKLKKTVVFVTHDMNAVREYCDRAILIEKQEIIADGTPDAIAKKYEQLLQPSSNNVGIEPKDKEWGDGVLKLSKVSLVQEKKHETIELSYIVTATQDCEDPTLGFVIMNGSGSPLFGTNTMMEKTHLGRMKSGDKKRIIWKFSNILPDGEYSTTIAAQYDTGSTTAHWWESAVTFSVTKDSRTPYAIQPSIDAIIKNM